MARQEFRIIVEGMDGAGKTTLINNLMGEFPKSKLIVNTEGPNQNFDEWWPAQLEVEASEIIPIHDRFFFSELVYGPILRKSIKADQAVVNNVAWFLRSTSLLIYARPHSDRLRAGAEVKPQMEGVIDQFTQLLELYDHIMMVEKAWFGNRFYHYDWAREGEFPIVRNLVRKYLAGELR